jgi:hypothetical protein
MPMSDKALRADRQTRQDILTAANYQCQLNYPDCTVTATELADVGDHLKAACKPCRLRREMNRSQGNRLAAHALRRTRP